MNVTDIIEAKHIGHSKWEQFQRDFRNTYPKRVDKNVLQSYNFKPYFEEMMHSFEFFYDMSIDYMDESPEEYNREDRNPSKVAEHWREAYGDNFEVLNDEVSSFSDLNKSVPSGDLIFMTMAISRWITENAKLVLSAR